MKKKSIIKVYYKIFFNIFLLIFHILRAFELLTLSDVNSLLLLLLYEKGELFISCISIFNNRVLFAYSHCI